MNTSRERAPQLREHLERGGLEREVRVAREERRHEVGVARRGDVVAREVDLAADDVPLLGKVGEGPGVGEVAVVGEGDAAGRGRAERRLGVLPDADPVVE
jgi:hypothetical protein